MKSTMRIKLKPKDIDHDRYIGVGRIIEIFDDIAEELLIRNEGHNGRLKEYKELEYIKPLICGDYVEVVGEVISFNDTILKIKFEVFKVLDGELEEYLLVPELACKAIAIYEVVINN